MVDYVNTLMMLSKLDESACVVDVRTINVQAKRYVDLLCGVRGKH